MKKWIFILVGPDTACYGKTVHGNTYGLKRALVDLFFKLNGGEVDAKDYNDFCRGIDLFDSKGYFNSEKQDDLNEVTRFLRKHGVPVFIGLFDMDDTFLEHVVCY